jgi:hypothetical protein
VISNGVIDLVPDKDAVLTELSPPRTATGRPLLLANRTAAITSATPRQRAISAGKRSIDPFQTLRCSS